MKKLILTFFASVWVIMSIAQPGFFNYQAVVRNTQGENVANQDVSFKIEILKGSSDGSPVYTETHEATTNELGLVNLKIFGGAQSGMMTVYDVDWGADNYFIKVYLDADGGTDFVEMGTSQLLTVPYAMHAYTVDKNKLPDTYEKLVVTDSLRIGAKGIKIGEIFEIKGKTDATNNNVSIALPTSSVRVLNIEITNSTMVGFSSYGLGFTGTGGTIGYHLTSIILGTPTLTIYYPDSLKDKNFTVTLMRIAY